MNNLANHILYRANKLNKPITNLQLQKVWYFTLGYLINQGYKKKAEEEFEGSNLQAWLYGPVVPELYEKYKEYKSTPIQDQGCEVGVYTEAEIQDMIDKLIMMNPFTLVDMSHTHTLWVENKKAIENNGYRPKYRFENLEETFNG
ncbi:DUF4065 domain-containing protein [Staphylococcus saprophyticus]|uniref:Panacea domain-containing protein n=1 Tax=Staphylococcus saprophyticus TaxID=29385 RepID=UPI0022EB13D0|nr:type II toxin-antitoxin system antitoxin SocA domain-containing protein [Staphylococcus saprophyticus]MDW3988281.1 DUF4065 domain-containing protein [Staphylococcus saprophyticus]MDW4094958.1 DUF4065 domain-containing protein [Staphylococcus saprophyticus]